MDQPEQTQAFYRFVASVPLAGKLSEMTAAMRSNGESQINCNGAGLCASHALRGTNSRDFAKLVSLFPEPQLLNLVIGTIESTRVLFRVSLMIETPEDREPF